MDDVWDDDHLDDESVYLRKMAEQEQRSLERRHAKAAFVDGRDQGHDEGYQKSYQKGFEDGKAYASALGHMYGALSIAGLNVKNVPPELEKEANALKQSIANAYQDPVVDREDQKAQWRDFEQNCHRVCEALLNCGEN
eukprot:Clim_evm42s251 gene=Clim_evmTU42s251